MKLSTKDIKPNPENPRTIKDDKFKKLVQSLKDFPEMAEVREVVVNKDHMILGGNMRFKAMVEAGWKEIPVRVVDWTPEQQREFIIKDNVSGGEWDWDLLANEWDSDLLDDWGLDVPGGFGDDEVEEDEAPEVSSESPVSELGVVYQLGRHRVMCGDSTDFGATTDLLDGKTIDLIFSDPPYGIDVVNNDMVGADFGVAKKGKYSKVVNDDTTDSAQNFYIVVKELCDKIILWGGNYFVGFLPFSDGWLVWDKRGDSGIKNTFADGELAWCSFHTPVRLYTQLWNGMIREGEKEKRVHPTQKPLQTLSKIINDFSKPEQLIYDGFLGSGSTLIACEQTDRTCYGMELDPKYADVIRKRYAKFVNNNELPENWEELTPCLNA